MQLYSWDTDKTFEILDQDSNGENSNNNKIICFVKQLSGLKLTQMCSLIFTIFSPLLHLMDLQNMFTTA